MLVSYLSTTHPSPEHFAYYAQLTADKITNRPFAIYVGNDLLKYSAELFEPLCSGQGIIISLGEKLAWEHFSPHVWHLQITEAQTDQLFELIQGQIQLLLHHSGHSQSDPTHAQLKNEFEAYTRRTDGLLANLLTFIAHQLETTNISKLRFRSLVFLLENEHLDFSAGALMRYSQKRKKWSIVAKVGDWSHLEDITNVPHLPQQIAQHKSEVYVQQIISGHDYVLVVSKSNQNTEIIDYEIKFFHLFAIMMKAAFETKNLQENLGYELKQNEKNQIALQKAIQTKDDFLASMSHELRTPLNAILGQTQLMKMGVHGKISKKQLKSVDGIHSSGEHLLALINDILDLSKLESVEITLNRTEFDAVALGEDCLTYVDTFAKNKNIRIVSSGPVIAMMIADQRRVKQILINLLSNAVKFTPDGGKIGLEIEYALAKNIIHFHVWDTGIGIAQEDFSKLFQSFMQIDSKLNRQYNGTGLGLALVDRLTRIQGGKVGLTSEVNKGSRFTITLPVYPPGHEIKAKDNQKIKNYLEHFQKRNMIPDTIFHNILGHSQSDSNSTKPKNKAKKESILANMGDKK